MECLESLENPRTVVFSYEFLEDYHVESLKDWWKIPSCFRCSAPADVASNADEAGAENPGSSIIFGCTSDSTPENKIDWRPKFSAKDHPLAQMVSWLDCVALATPSKLIVECGE